MATQFDTAFLKIAVYNNVTDQQTAARCLQLLDQAQQGGHAVRAPDLLARTGVAPNVLQRLSAMTEAAMKQQGIQPGSPGGQPAAQQSAPAPSATAVAAPPTPAQRGSSARVPRPTPTNPAAHQSQRQAAQAPAAGDTLEPVSAENVELREKIGSGPTGHLYAGKDKSTGTALALKVLTRKFAKSEKVQEMVLKTLNHAAAAKLKHPNIASIHTVFEKENRNIVVFDHAQGESLDGMLQQKGSLSQARCVQIGLQVATALHYAHSRRLCHGDIRPAKIMVDGDSVKLTDFGMAHATALIQGYSRAGVPFGHPCYLAPEIVQAKQRQPTPQSDLYALGIMLYEMLIGERPFVGEDPRRVLQAHLRTPLPKPPETAGLNQKVALAIFKLTAKDPKSRIPSAAHAVQMFRLLDGLGLEDSGEIESVSEEDWRYQSEETAAPQDWSEENVAAAPGLNVGNWDPEDGEDDDRRPGVSGRMAGVRSDKPKFAAAGDDLTALAASLAKAADEGKKIHTITKREQDRKDSRGDIGNAGNRLKLVGAEVRQRQSQLQWVLAGVLIFVGVSAAGSMVAFSPRKEVERKPQLVHDKTAEIKAAASDVDQDEIQRKAKTELQRKVSKLLAEIDSGIGVAVNNGNYKTALTLIRFFENPVGPDPKITAKLKGYTERAIELGNKALKAQEESVKKALKSHNIKIMKTTLSNVKIFEALEQHKPMLRVFEDQLNSAIADQMKWQVVQSTDLKLKKWQKQFKTLRFVQPVFEEQNRVILFFDFAQRAELKDFGLGKKVKALIDTDNREVTIAAGEEPVLLLFPVPPQHVNSVKLEYTPAKGALRKGTEISFVTSLDTFSRSSGLRLTVTSQAIAFKKVNKGGNKVVKETIVGRGKLADPWSQKRHIFELKVSRNRVRATLDKRKVVAKAGELDTGLCGVYLRNVNIVIHRLKFDVVVEPEEIKRWIKSKK